jgi:hypothetical protein
MMKNNPLTSHTRKDDDDDTIIPQECLDISSSLPNRSILVLDLYSY